MGRRPVGLSCRYAVAETVLVAVGTTLFQIFPEEAAEFVWSYLDGLKTALMLAAAAVFFEVISYFAVIDMSVCIVWF